MVTNFSQIDVIPKIKDVVLGKTIGQGAFAFVKKASLKQDSNAVFAVKFVHLDTCKRHGLTDERIANEVLIHKKCSSNSNVIKLLDYNISKHYMWIAIELAEGGDLFDKIEPDIGLVDTELAQFYFQQLITAVDYLHSSCGVAHRDIKPENILLDKCGNMKLADFGLATVFRKKSGNIKWSSDICGSPPYMAPDILDPNGYRSDTADIWSCGVLLFVLLTGTTPWEEPTMNDEWYSVFMYSDGQILDGSWSKVDLMVLNLLRGILKPQTDQRFTIERIKHHKWFKHQVSFADENCQCSNSEELFKRLTTPLKVSLRDEDYEQCTQQLKETCENTNNIKLPSKDKHKYVASQPLEGANAEAVILTHDIFDTDVIHAATQDPFFSLGKSSLPQDSWNTLLSQDPSVLQYQEKKDIIKNTKLFENNNIFTRFYSVESIENVLSMLESAIKAVDIKVHANLLQDYESLLASLGPDLIFPLSMAIKTIDTRKLLLTGFIKIQTLNFPLKTITFVRTKGDPLEWRKLFKNITVLCRDIVFYR